MRKGLLLIPLFMMVIETAFSQDVSRMDSIFYNNGKVEAVIIKKTSSELIEFCYPMEDVVNELYKNQLEKIVYRSGRVEVCEQSFYVPKITNADQWNQVIITDDKDKLKGRVKVETVTVRSMSGGSLGKNKALKQLKEKLQKKAAEMKCGLVYIEDICIGGTFGCGTTSTATGVLYK